MLRTTRPTLFILNVQKAVRTAAGMKVPVCPETPTENAQTNMPVADIVHSPSEDPDSKVQASPPARPERLFNEADLKAGFATIADHLKLLNILVIEHHLKSHEAKTESEETINDLCKDLESVIRRLGIPLSAEPDGKVDHYQRAIDLMVFAHDLCDHLVPGAVNTKVDLAVNNDTRIVPPHLLVWEWLRSTHRSLDIISHTPFGTVAEGLRLLPNRFKYLVAPKKDTSPKGAGTTPSEASQPRSLIKAIRHLLNNPEDEEARQALNMRLMPKIDNARSGFDVATVLTRDMVPSVSQELWIAIEQHTKELETSDFALIYPGVTQTTISMRRVICSKDYDFVMLKQGNRDIALFFFRRNKRREIEYAVFHPEGRLWDAAHRVREAFRFDDTRYKLNFNIIRNENGSYASRMVDVNHKLWLKHTKFFPCLFRSTIRRSGSGCFSAKVTVHKEYQGEDLTKVW